ncbi:MAG: hypothetical protein K0R17_386 [Rariglobus sp.]|jgi:hypothetical protein|nr:hypothetical protein [Rariglobus sp.]
MDMPVSESLLRTIQLSITPVILITGLGSLLLTMTNRMGRVVDRTRILAGQAHAAGGTERRHIEDQLRIMYRRSKIVQLAVTLGAASMFSSGLLVIAIFSNAILGANFSAVILTLFVTSILLLLGALAAFLRDIYLALNALELEVSRALDHPAVK